MPERWMHSIGQIGLEMTKIFNAVVQWFNMEGPSEWDNFEPPIQLPIGMKIKVNPEDLTEEGKKSLDADGCITIEKIDYSL